MNELDIEFVKENYKTYKSEHYEDEREMRILLKLKKLLPYMAENDVWKREFNRVNDNLSSGLYYYNELKELLDEKSLAEFFEDVRFEILEDRYMKFNIGQLENVQSPEKKHLLKFEEMEKIQDNFEIIQNLEKIIQKTNEKIGSLSETLDVCRKISEGKQCEGVGNGN